METLTKTEDKVTLKPYKRTAMYYETDQMGIIHHSNYIRWFEEARLDYLNQINLNYSGLEELGIMIPVLSVNCEYKYAVRFNETVYIIPVIETFNGVKMQISYQILDAATNKIRTTGISTHCFVTKDMKPVNMKKYFKDIYDILKYWSMN
jgi:acyl-CoA thioester hydrolase